MAFALPYRSNSAIHMDLFILREAGGMDRVHQNANTTQDAVD